MNTRHRRLLLASALLAGAWLAAPLSAAAQTATGGPGAQVWRCGADGRVFSDQPCREGRQLETPAPRPEADVRAAETRAARERRMAERAHRERLAAEARQRGNGLANLGPEGAPQTAALKPSQASKLAAKERSRDRQRQPQRRARAPDADAGTSSSADRASRRMPG